MIERFYAESDYSELTETLDVIGERCKPMGDVARAAFLTPLQVIASDDPRRFIVHHDKLTGQLRVIPGSVMLDLAMPPEIVREAIESARHRPQPMQASASVRPSLLRRLRTLLRRDR